MSTDGGEFIYYRLLKEPQNDVEFCLFVYPALIYVIYVFIEFEEFRFVWSARMFLWRHFFCGYLAVRGCECGLRRCEPMDSGPSGVHTQRIFQHEPIEFA